jgi:hypothetical protein
MTTTDHKLFIRWFLGSIALFYAVLCSFNFLLDPFFKYDHIKPSPSNEYVSRPYNELLLKLAVLDKKDATKFIFGDSRGNGFNSKILRKVEADTWFNVSIGGASPLEVVSLLEYIIEHLPKEQLEHIVIVLPMRLFVDRRQNRFDEAKGLLNNDFLYLSNTLVLKTSFANVMAASTGKQSKTQKQGGKKADAWQYWLRHAELKALDWQIPEQIMERYSRVFATLREKNIPFTIMLPPVHREIQTIYREGTPEVWAAYQAFFESFDESFNCMVDAVNDDKALFKDPYHAGDDLNERVFRQLVSGESGPCN